MKNTLEDRINQGKLLANYHKAIMDDSSISQATKDEVDRLFHTYIASFLAYYDDIQRNHPDLRKVLEARKKDIEKENLSYDRNLIYTLTAEQVSRDVSACTTSVQQMAMTFQTVKTNEQAKLNDARENIRNHLSSYCLNIEKVTETLREDLTAEVQDLTAEVQDLTTKLQEIDAESEKGREIQSRIDQLQSQTDQLQSRIEELNGIQIEKGEYITAHNMQQSDLATLERILEERNLKYGALYSAKKDSGDAGGRTLKEKADMFGAWHKIITARDIDISPSAEVLFGKAGKKLVEGAAKLKNSKSYEEARQAMIGLIGEDMYGVKPGASMFKLDKEYNEKIAKILSQRNLYAFYQGIIQRTGLIEKQDGLDKLQEYAKASLLKDIAAAIKTNNIEKASELITGQLLNIISKNKKPNAKDKEAFQILHQLISSTEAQEFRESYSKNPEVFYRMLPKSSNITSNNDKLIYLKRMVEDPNFHAAVFDILQIISPSAELDTEFIKKFNHLYTSLSEMPNIQSFVNHYKDNSESIHRRLPKSHDITANPDKHLYLRRMVENPNFHAAVFDILQIISPSAELDTEFIKKFNHLYTSLSEMPNIQSFLNYYKNNPESIHRRLPRSHDITANPDKMEYLARIASNPAMHNMVFTIFNRINNKPHPMIDSEYITKFNRLYDELLSVGLQEAQQFTEIFKKEPKKILEMLPVSSDLIHNPSKLQYLKNLVKNYEIAKLAYDMVCSSHADLDTDHINKINKLFDELSTIQQTESGKQYFAVIKSNPQIAYKAWDYLEKARLSSSENPKASLSTLEKAQATAYILSNLPKDYDHKNIDYKIKEIFTMATEKRTLSNSLLHINLIPAAAKSIFDPKFQKLANTFITKFANKLTTIEKTQAINTLLEIVTTTQKNLSEEEIRLRIDAIEKVANYLNHQLNNTQLPKAIITSKHLQKYLANATSNPILAGALNSIITQNEKRGMLNDLEAIKTFNLIFDLMEEALPAAHKKDPQIVREVVDKLKNTICKDGKLSTANLGLSADYIISKAVKEVTTKPTRQHQNTVRHKALTTDEKQAEFQKRKNISRFKHEGLKHKDPKKSNQIEIY